MNRIETCMHYKCMWLYGTVEIIPKNVERAEGRLFIVVSDRKVLIIDGLACLYFTSNKVLQFATLNARRNWADLKSSGIR